MKFKKDWKAFASLIALSIFPAYYYLNRDKI